jgi:hypothetical protein
VRGQHIADQRLTREVDGGALAPKLLQDLVAPDARARGPSEARRTTPLGARWLDLLAVES